MKQSKEQSPILGHEVKAPIRILETGRVNGGFPEGLAVHPETVNLLQESSELGNVLLENLPNPVLLIGLDTSVKYVNSALESLTGFKRAELVGKKSPYPWWAEDDTNRFEYGDNNAMAKEYNILEKCYCRKNGDRFWVGEQIKTIGYGGRVKCYLATWADITERKIAEEKIRESERCYRLLAENSSDVLWTNPIDNPELVTFVSPSIERLLGYSAEEAKSKSMEEIFTPESIKIAMAAFTETMAAEMSGRMVPFHSKKLELRLRHKNGFDVPVEINYSLIRGSDGRPVSILAVVRDITERKQAEQALRESEAKYRSLVEAASAGIVTYSPEGIITFVNNTLCSLTGYSLDEMLDKSISDFIYQEDLPLIWQRFSNANLGIPMTQPAEYRILCKNKQLLWLQSNAKPIRIEGQITGFSAILQDITERRKAEDNLSQSLDKLKRALQGSIDTAARMVEMKDPYTAGHQQKVTRLSMAIAQEMGMPEEQINYLGMAAMVHDIGKMYVPAEILSRTGRLSNLEYEMMKTHVQGSYEILKTIEFPWPIAEIVLQHHERMDGSGYPQGLKGDEILLEARIIALADTVEAMSSHRPYRPAFGIGEALEEISSNKGKLYDSRVVEACINLFLERGFRF